MLPFLFNHDVNEITIEIDDLDTPLELALFALES